MQIRSSKLVAQLSTNNQQIESYRTQNTTSLETDKWKGRQTDRQTDRHACSHEIDHTANTYEKQQTYMSTR